VIENGRIKERVLIESRNRPKKKQKICLCLINSSAGSKCVLCWRGWTKM